MLVISPKDNVGVLLEDAEKGDSAVCGDISITLADAVKFAHKAALAPIPKGENIIKYGEVIGYALRDIAKGEWAHIHNLDDERGREGRLS